MEKPVRFIFFILSMMLSLSASSQSKPNIVVILADDLGYSDIGCYGSEINTPNIDKLATGGLRLTQVYNSAICCPTRASLLTGLQPHQVGLGHMVFSSISKEYEGYSGFRSDNNVTIPEVLNKAGYFTAMSGKWHIAPGVPTDRGFKEFYGLVGGFTSFWDPAKYKRLPQSLAVHNYPQGKFYATDAITDYAIDFIDSAKANKKPLFLYLAYNAPHFPLHAPKEETDKYFEYYKRGWDKVREERYERMKKMGILEDNNFKLSPRGIVPESAMLKSSYPIPNWESLSKDQQLDLARRMAIFAGMVDRMDQNIGRVLDKLKKENQLDNTLIIFMSDNGGCAEWTENGFDKSSGLFYKVHKGAELYQMGLPGTYHHYGTGWANVSNTPWSSYKHYTQEGGISSPSIVFWPEKLKNAGKLNATPMHVTDVMATCVDAAGVDYPKEFNGHQVLPKEGMSMMPVITGQKAQGRVICVEHEGNRMVRQGDWKLVSNNYDSNKWQLFNIAKDRSEQNNLAERNPSKVKEMENLYQQWAKKSHVMPWDEISPFKNGNGNE